MTKVSIIGATGYAGAELVRLLMMHPHAEIVSISSHSFEGSPLSEIYPAFGQLNAMICDNQTEAVNAADIVFAALPHGLSEGLAQECFEKGKIFIDLGADFRFYDEKKYKEWYGLDYKHTEVHNQAVYALPELFRDKIKGKKIIGNPGCYPTSAALALAPAIKNNLISSTGIIADSKSGVTGAGRGLTQATHFPDCNEAFGPYKVASHRHTPEIEQTLGELFEEKVTITFVPHLLPVNRGILTTAYARLEKDLTEDDIHKIYVDFYKDEYFVRVLPKGLTANIKTIKCSNFCDISVHLDARTNTLITVSAIDNMVKGAAGQAVQNMNILLGLDEKIGLEYVPPAF